MKYSEQTLKLNNLELPTKALTSWALKMTEFLSLKVSVSHRFLFFISFVLALIVATEAQSISEQTACVRETEFVIVEEAEITFGQAEQRCVVLNGTLASIRDEEEFKLIKNAITNIAVELLWIGTLF